MTAGAQDPIRIIGRYALHQEIAAGGMATVHLGRLLGPAGFSRTVAIKRLHAQYAKDPEFVSMFLDEARLAARIRHAGVVSTLDVVALEGELFIVMDYVEGESLARLIRASRARGELIPTKIAFHLMISVLYGLHGAHEAKGERGEKLGIVHRDVSPQNILVDTEGVARMVDFGVAKAAGRLQTTREGQLKGKLAYMAPEQLKGETIDRRTDVFAASIVLWETLTGRRLFQGENEGMTFGKVIECQVEPPSKHVEGLSPEIDAIVLRGLAKNLDDRYPTALDMAEDLEQVAVRPRPRDVARWVRELAEETLAKRAEQVRELESHSTVNALVLAQDPRHISSPSLKFDASDKPSVSVAEKPEPPRPTIASVTEPIVADEQPSAPAPATAPEPSAPAPPAAASTDDSAADDEAMSAALTTPLADRAALEALAALAEPSGTSQISSVSVMKTAPPPPIVRRVPVIAFALGGAALLTLLVIAVIAFSGRSAPKTQASSAPAATTTQPPREEPPADTTPSPTSVESAAPPIAASALPIETTKRAPASSGKTNTRPATKSKPNCNPPYTTDKDGTRIPKPECL